MSFGDAIKTCFNKYVNLNGRARRSEYWFFVLFVVIVEAVVEGIANTSDSGALASFSNFVTLALFIPQLAVEIRRMHDIGKSGWNVLFSLIPLVGWIIILVFTLRDSQPGDNRYGPNPKGVQVFYTNTDNKF